jgi:hypothetical protein
MAVIREIRAADGDTLCSIGVDSGFKNCTKLRPHNPDYNTRPLAPGDLVKVPEVTRKDEAGQTEMTHKFVRKGKTNRVWIIQDRHRATGQEARGDAVRELAVSNFVTGRQSRGFAPDPWRDATFFGFSAGASADPDHFRLLIHDLHAHRTNTDTVEVQLRTQRPVLGHIPNEIQSWQNLTQPGTTLGPIRCRRWNNPPWYRSPYLRLVVDEEDRQLRRTDGRINIANDNGGTSNDAGTAVTDQVLLTPALDDLEIEILDYRVEAFRPAPDCEHGDANGKCRARASRRSGRTRSN